MTLAALLVASTDIAGNIGGGALLVAFGVATYLRGRGSQARAAAGARLVAENGGKRETDWKRFQIISDGRAQAKLVKFFLWTGICFIALGAFFMLYGGVAAVI